MRTGKRYLTNRRSRIEGREFPTLHSPLSPLHSRRGFTLVEMLVSISIILVLLAMTVTAVNFSISGDRIPSAARLAQSHLEGAISRAILAANRSRSEFPGRGVRFLLDPDGPTKKVGTVDVPITVNGMLFIEAGGVQAGEVDSQRVWIGSQTVMTPPDQQTINFVSAGPADEWENLRLRGMLREGARISLTDRTDTNGTPIFGDYDYRITPKVDNTGTVMTDVAGRVIWRLTKDFPLFGWDPTPPPPGGKPNAPLYYRVELAPVVSPGQDPQLFPSGIVIDLEHSAIPSHWQLATGAYLNELDVMFSPSGAVTNIAEGAVHLLLTDVENVTLAFNPTPSPGSYGWPINAEEQRLVTVFTHTGRVTVAPVLIETDANGNGAVDPGEDTNGNGVLDQTIVDTNDNGRYEPQLGEGDPFYFAETGEEAK